MAGERVIALNALYLVNGGLVDANPARNPATGGSVSGGSRQPSLLVFDLADSNEWIATPSDPFVELAQDPHLSCDAEGVLVTGLATQPLSTSTGFLSIHRFAFAQGVWSAVASPDIPSADYYPARRVGLIESGLWTGTELLFPDAAYALDPATSLWHSLSARPPGEGAISVWTGEAVAGYVTTQNEERVHASVFSYQIT